MDEVYDDSVCVTCGQRLSNEPRPHSWPDHGFCRLLCALRYTGGLTLSGEPAKVLAQMPGSQGGPGFESDIVREWLKAATDAAPALLRRVPAHADGMPGQFRSWSWRLHSGGKCRAQRLTTRDLPAAGLGKTSGG